MQGITEHINYMLYLVHQNIKAMHSSFSKKSEIKNSTYGM